MTSIAITRRANRPMPPRAGHVVALCGCLLAALAVVAAVHGSGDYRATGSVGADNAAPAIVALAHLRLAAFLSHQPVIGLTSLLARAPMVALAGRLGSGGGMLAFRLGALVCLLPAVFLLAWLLTDAPVRPAFGAVVLAGAVILLGPSTVAAINAGHPEEVLAAALIAAALLAAGAGRPLAAGGLLGAAAGTKAWALIAVVPVLLSIPCGRGRGRATVAAAGTGALGVGAAPLLDPHAFSRAATALDGSHLTTAVSAWWPLSHSKSGIVARLPGGLDRSAALTLTLVAILAAACALHQIGQRPGGRLHAADRVTDWFAVLCLLAAVRCVADPLPIEYYFAAVVTPLVVWEVAQLRRVPVVSVLVVLAARWSFGPGLHLRPALLNVVVLIWTAALIGYLGVHAFWLGRDRPESPIPCGG